MDHFVIGTAGHVDHGKTELVKALTGYDTDRLKEEKERGMTIELGFAPFRLEDNKVSIVDVPGHEKLVKTMVSGASGMDMALIIIDANEGIMPQTIEHIQILSLLNVTSVIIVITKIDLVSDIELQERIEEIKNYLTDTNYKDAPVQSVSSKTGTGIKELGTIIVKEGKSLTRPRSNTLFIMPIDRVFTMKGHGTVVTGTIQGGQISEDDLIQIVDGDNKISSRVKNLQVHSKVQKEAYAGSRCAINLNRVEKSLIKRGSVMIKPDTIESTGWIDTVIYNVSKNIIKHNQRVRINIGTVEVIGKLRIIGANKIDSHKEGYASIKLEKPIIAIRQDRFIIRALTPVTTIGGGIILSHRSKMSSRWKEETLQYFHMLEENSIKKIVDYILNKYNNLFDVDTLYARLYCNREYINNVLEELASEGKAIKLNHYYVSKTTIQHYTNRLKKAFEEYYKHDKYCLFIDKEGVRSKYFSELDINEFQALIGMWIDEKIIHSSGYKVAMKDEGRIRQLRKDKVIREMDKICLDAGMNCLDQSRLDQLKYKTTTVDGIIKFLQDINRIIKIDNGLYIHINNYTIFIKTIERLFKEKKQLTVIEARDALKIGRKRTINLLEYLDEQGYTKRIDNYRVKCN